MTGCANGEVGVIQRIPFIPTDLPFQYKRLKFRVELSFSMNKSHGHTFNVAGLELRVEYFSKGQQSYM